MELPALSLWKESPVEGVPVIPYGNFLTGHMHLLLERDFQKSLRNFSVEHADEQGRCTFWMGATTPSLSVTRCEDVQVLLKFSSYREFIPGMATQMEKFFGKCHLATLAGDEWRTKRSAIVKALHGQKVIDHNKKGFQHAADNLVKSLAVVEFVEDISLVMKMLTLDAFGLANLSMDFGCCQKLKQSGLMKDFEYASTEVKRRATTIHALNPASHVYDIPTESNKTYNSVLSRMDNFFFEIIDKRMEKMANSEGDIGVARDLLTSLIEELTPKDDKIGEEDTERILVDTLKSLLFSGYETTSVTLTYVLYLLSKHPDAEKRCIQEIRKHPEEHVYLDAVIKETLRLFPPVISTTRMVERDVRFAGLHVPKGTYVYFPIWVIQRDEGHFRGAEKFIPERWARFDDVKGAWIPRDVEETNDFEGVPAGNSKAFVAFSSGARACPGQRYVMQNMSIVLSTLLKHYKFEVSDDYVLTMHHEGFVQCPKGGMPMNIQKR